MRRAACALWFAFALPAADWKPLFNGRNLDGWEVRGECLWNVTREGILLGQRPHAGAGSFTEWPVSRQQFGRWMNQRAWLYTRADYEEFDLSLEYFLLIGGNSGVSIRDTSRARYAFDPEWDPSRTPSHIGYEIQILDGTSDRYPTGSIYLFAPARTGWQKPLDRNTLEIESRRQIVRVKLNGHPVSESPGDPARSQTGPIGLQLHDRLSWAMFRNIRMRQAGR